jgi:protein-tyrosine phosphatase
MALFVPEMDRLEIEGLQALYLGSHPFEGLSPEATEREQCRRLFDYIDAVKEKGVKAVTVLLPEPELERVSRSCDLIGRYRAAELQVLHFPLENFSVPDALDMFDELIRNILEILREKELLIHCLTGCGRTGMVASGVLVRLGLPVPDAIERVNRVRSGTTHTFKQIIFLKDYRSWIAASG